MPGRCRAGHAAGLRLPLFEGRCAADEFREGLEIADLPDHLIVVPGDVPVDQNVAEPRKAGELSHELRRELLVGRQTPYGPGVVLEALPAARGQFPRDVDDQLSRGQQGEQDVVVKAQVPPQGFGPLDPRFQPFR